MNDLIVKLLGLPEQASKHAAEIDNMLALVHIFMLILFVGWSIFFIFTLIKFRQSKHPKANYEGLKNHMSNYVEFAVVIVEALLLLMLAFPLWAQRVGSFPLEEESVRVHVIAEQFAWNIHYPGKDGIFGKRDIGLVSSDNSIGIDRSDPAAQDDIITINQLHVPIDQPILVYLTSKDVVHSFALREMRALQDVIPGMEIPLWFTPTKEGKYEIACAQLCGLGHYRMRGFLTVESQEKYKNWLNENAPEIKETIVEKVESVNE